MKKNFSEWLMTKYPEAYEELFREFENDTTKKGVITFSEWWELYGKKVGRRPAEKKWQKLTITDKEKIAQHTPIYVANTPEKQYRLNPLTYLNQKRYNDEEIITYKKTGTKQRVAENLSKWQDLLNR